MLLDWGLAVVDVGIGWKVRRATRYVRGLATVWWWEMLDGGLMARNG